MPISVSEVASQRWCPELNLVRWLICKTTCIAFVSTSRDPFVASRWRRRVIRGVLISGARRGAAETHKKKGIYTRQDYLSTSTRGHSLEDFPSVTNAGQTRERCSVTDNVYNNRWCWSWKPNTLEVHYQRTTRALFKAYTASFQHGLGQGRTPWEETSCCLGLSTAQGLVGVRVWDRAARANRSGKTMCRTCFVRSLCRIKKNCACDAPNKTTIVLTQQIRVEVKLVQPVIKKINFHTRNKISRGLK